jgi:hypothetical protein
LFARAHVFGLGVKRSATLEGTGKRRWMDAL